MTGYAVQVLDTRTGAVVQRTVVAPATSVTVPTTSRTTRHLVEVRAVNAVGPGEAAKASATTR